MVYLPTPLKNDGVKVSWVFWNSQYMENKCSKPPTSYHVPYWKYHLGGGIHHFETDPDESIGCSFIHWGRKRTKLKSISVPFRIAGAEVRINGWYVGWAPIMIYCNCMYIYMVCGWCEYIWTMMVTGVQSPEYNLDLYTLGYKLQSVSYDFMHHPMDFALRGISHWQVWIRSDSIFSHLCLKGFVAVPRNA